MIPAFLTRLLSKTKASAPRTLPQALAGIEGDGWGLLIRLANEDGDNFVLIEAGDALKALADEPLLDLLVEQPEIPRLPSYTATLLRDRTAVARFDLDAPPGFNFDHRLSPLLDSIGEAAHAVENFTEWEVIGRHAFDALQHEIETDPDVFALEPPPRVPSVFSKRLIISLPAMDVPADTPDIRIRATRRVEAALRLAFREDDLFAIDQISFDIPTSRVRLRRAAPGTRGLPKGPIAKLPHMPILIPVAHLSAESAFVDHACREAEALLPQDIFWSSNFAHTLASIAQSKFEAAIEDCCLDADFLIATTAFENGPNRVLVPHFRVAESA